VTLGSGDLIAVTGAGGNVGLRVVDDLLAAGYSVRSLSRTRSRKLPAEVEHVTADLAAGQPLDPQGLKDCAAVIHLAAHIPVNQNDPASAKACFETNALGTLRLLEAMDGAGVDRLIQTTSANAYAPERDEPSEEDPMYPSARAPFYLSSKLVQDILASHWSLRTGMAVTTLRISSVYGAGLESALFTRFARTLRSGGKVRLANGGSFGADFVELGDVSAALAIVLKSGFTGPLNIASGKRTTLLEAARLLAELIGSGEEALIVESEERYEPGFPAIGIANARAVGFAPTDLRTGLERVVSWIDETPAASD